ncbi:MAG: hypothetical protein ACI9R3_004995 [Verrucomicrobiales bacterium]|jgi:hypothetical protein
MSEEQLKEDAELYALGMLDSAERGRFQRRLEELPDLESYVAELEDAIVGVALTAPAEEVDPVVLERVLAQIGHDGESRMKRWGGKILKVPGGWPAAAALVLLLCGGIMRYGKVRDDLARAEGERDAVVREMRNMIVVLDGGEPNQRGEAAAAAALDGATGTAANSLVQAAQRKSYRLLQNLERVNHELAQVRDREAERSVAHPGIARPMVVSMWDPDVPVEERENAHMLSEEVSNFIGDQLEAAGEEETADESEKEGTQTGGETSMSFDSWPEVEVTGDALAPLWFTRDLPKGPRIRHKNFPTQSWDDMGLTRYENGTYFDPESELLYTPSLNGTDYIGKRPPSGFDPDSGMIPADPEPIETTVPAVEPPPLLLPKAFTIYDETTGEGSIILQNLPPQDEDTTYHLWLNDSQATGPIEVGILPDLESGDGRVFFDLQPGLSPSGYILTAEPKGETPRVPGEEIILYGP